MLQPVLHQILLPHPDIATSLSGRTAETGLTLAVQGRNSFGMAQIEFGTDGWRAVIAEDFTFSNLERVSQATADYWSSHPAPGTEKKVVIGYDRRFLSDQF